MNKNFVFLTVLLASVFASCSSDEPTAPEDRFDGSYDGQAYMRVRISMADDAAARAGDFETGTDEEQAIKEIGLKFYNSDGSFYGYGLPVTNPTDTSTPIDNVDGTIEDAVIVLQINSNAPKPTHVVAYVNCGDSWKQTNSEPNIDIIDGDKQIKESITTEYSGKTHYAMTSSNYYGTGSGDETHLGYRTPVNHDSFKSTEEEAMASTVPVNIYVERLAAKVKVNTVDNMNPKTIENNGYTLNFVIDGYSLGGVNNESYYIKKLDSSWKDASPWDGWNAPEWHRCYWAWDINYDNAISNHPELDYVSYNKVENSLDESKTSWLYTAENTMKGMSESGTQGVQTTELNRYLFQPFAYVIGHYEVTKDGTPVTDDNLYEYAGKILPQEAMLTYMQQMIGTVLYTKDGDTYNGVNLATEGFVELGSYQYGDEGNKKTDASLVCLQLTDIGKEAIANGNYYIKKQNETEPNKYDYVEATETEVVPLLKQSDTQAYGFKYDVGRRGYLAYFPILIKHLNTGIGINTDEIGYYGVVRNHCYYITINKIEGLGIGIFNTEVDIIPKDKIKPLYLAAKFNVLSWKVVNQSVDL